jgi:DNA-binding MarR family transcriptional regulator
MPMRAIADSLSCEPSNVTGIVDGLERRGLVVRQADPADRRVKQVVLTADGKRTRDLLRARGYAHAEKFFDVPGEVRVQLRDILAGLLAGAADGVTDHHCGEPRAQKSWGRAAH